ncbi:MAG: hypothetical protein ACKOQ6_12155 [Bacteroidota bacterium]
MSNFSDTEYAIARFLGKVPILKRSIKYFWQQASFFFNKPAFKSECDFHVVRLSSTSRPGFFGYYDLSPVNPSGTHIAFHEMKENGMRSSIAEIVVLDLVSNERKVIGETSMFNLQSGSRLQWLNESEIIYNFQKDEYSTCGTLRYDISTGQSRFYPFPVFVSDEHFAYSVNLQALLKSGNEYAYRKMKLEVEEEDEPMICRMDWRSGQSIAILTRLKLIRAGNREFPADCIHTVNHLMISPDKKKLLFIHRWYSSEGKSDRLMLLEIKDDSLKILNDEMSSHCCWLNESTIMGYMRHEGRDGYFLVTTSGELSNLLPASDLPVRDGHPSTAMNCIVFDTYPDKRRMQSLFLTRGDKTERIARFFSPITFNPYYRCDLHPRLNTNASCIFIDSDHDGLRSLYMIDLTAK